MQAHAPPRPTVAELGATRETEGGYVRPARPDTVRIGGKPLRMHAPLAHGAD